MREAKWRMLPPGVSILNQYYACSWTLDKFIESKKFCGIKIKESAENLKNWLKSILIAFPRSARKFEKPKSIESRQSYQWGILPAVKSKKKKFPNDLFNMCVKNDRGKIVGENWTFFQTVEWIKLHELVGDEIMLFLLTECAIYKYESTILIQKSGINLERLYLKGYIARKEAQTQQEPKRKRHFGEIKNEPKNKKRKIEEGMNDTKIKKIYRGRKKKLKNREKIIPGFQYSLQIPYSKVLYNALRNEKFPSNHVLNAKDTNTLKRKIFNTNVEDKNEDDRSKTIEKLIEMDMVLNNAKIDAVLEKFKRNHVKFDYNKCLRVNCPIPKHNENNNEFFNTTSQVLNFLRLILIKVVPKEIFGSDSNKRVMYHNLKKLIFSGRYDKFCLGQFMTRIRIKDCKWVGKEDGISLREKLVSKMILWLLTDYFITILKSYFYVTDTSFGFHKLFYYRQSKWRRLCETKIKQLIENKIFRKIENADEMEKLKNEGYGIGSFRFIPKISSLRPLVTQTKKNEMNLEKLRLVLCTLKYAIRIKPELIGRGSQSVRSAKDKWALYRKSMAKAENSKFYFVKVDVKDCFDSIIQSKLLEILESIYDFIFAKTHYVRVAKLHHLRRLSSGVFQRRVYIAGDMRDSFEKMLEDNRSSFVNENVIVDSGCRFIVTKPTMRSRLQRYVCSLLCTVPERACGNKRPIFHQIQGIVQGQMISSILCNIYYGAMDEEYLSSYSIRQENFLIRLIDDYLFVTPSIDDANRFLKQMARGFVDFNSKVNWSKCSTNLPMISEIYPEIQPLKNNSMLWLGSKIDVNTLDIFTDYSRYSDSDMESTMAHQFWKSSTYSKNKLINSLKLKSSESIYFDESCNSVTAVAQNIYDLFLISAFRFVCFVRFSGRKKSDNYVYHIIRSCSNTVFKNLSRLRNKRKNSITSFTKYEISYLSLLAFETKFLRLLNWRQMGRKLRYRRKKLLAKSRENIVNSVRTYPK